MNKRPKATIKPALLIWARETAGFDLPSAAEKLGLDSEKLAAWENGDDQPSIPQLRKMADLYKRPLAVLYLPKPPLTFQPMRDFRRLPEFGLQRFSPELTLEIRLAQQRRELAQELFEDADEKPRVFQLKAGINENPENVGSLIRNSLKITYELQSRWREPRVGFFAWRSKIEDTGALVFQASRIESAEASGFAIWADVFPVIAVNRKDVYSRRIFSLLHELVHLMLRQSGVSDLEADGPRPEADEHVEVFCNRVAASALMPEDLFLREHVVAAKGVGSRDWSDAEIQSLASIYCVSREAVVRRLFTFGRASGAFYGAKRQQYAVEFQQQRLLDKEKNKGKNIPRDMPRETVADFGRPLVRQVIENYHQDRLSLSDVSGYLGVKIRHVPGIERQLGL